MTTTKKYEEVTIEDLEKFWEIPALKTPPIIPNKIAAKNGRFYIDIETGLIRPSMNTVLSVINKGTGFERWLGNSNSYAEAMEYSKDKADRGTEIHILCMQLLLGIEIDISSLNEEDKKKMLSFVQFCQQTQLQPLLIETPLIHPNLPYAGTPDIVANINGELWLFDIKSGQNWTTYKYQIAGYKYLYEEIFGTTIDHIAVLRLKNWRGDNIPTVEDKSKYEIIENGDKKLEEPVSKDFLQNIYQLWAVENNTEPKLPPKLPNKVQLDINLITGEIIDKGEENEFSRRTKQKRQTEEKAKEETTHKEQNSSNQRNIAKKEEREANNEGQIEEKSGDGIAKSELSEKKGRTNHLASQRVGSNVHFHQSGDKTHSSKINKLGSTQPRDERGRETTDEQKTLQQAKGTVGKGTTGTPQKEKDGDRKTAKRGQEVNDDLFTFAENKKNKISEADKLLENI
ncbi:MAG TPA: hypothetical protein DHM37_01955 [Candidatus Cloacimonas sp.]|nr:hypothetical protein [Candidatus Cloacimonas sp.]